MSADPTPSLARLRAEILAPPNLITLGRVLLVLPVWWLLQPGAPTSSLVATGLFVLAAALDAVDGWLARRMNLVTFFGKFVDPLADKIMVMALLVRFVADGLVTPWVVAALLAREFYVSGLRMVALGEGIEMPAGRGGKLKTAIQLGSVALCCLAYVHPGPVVGGVGFGAIGRVGIFASVLVALWSAAGYTREFLRGLDGKGQATSP